MFRGLWAIAYKELLHIARDPATRFVFAIPVIQLILFGYAIRIDVENIPTAIVDLDDSYESRELSDLYANTRTFDLTHRFSSLGELEAALVEGTVTVGLYVPDGFGRAIHRGERAELLVLIDGSYSTEAASALNVSQAMALWVSRRIRATGVAPGELAQIRPGVPLANIDLRGRLLFNPNLRSANFFVPGLVGIILMLVAVMLTAFSIVREREAGTMEQLMVTPVGSWGLLIGKLLPYSAVAIIETTIVLVLMVYLFGVPIAGSLPLLAVLSALFLVTVLSLGVIISTVARNQAEAMQMTFLLILPSVLLSGFIFPLQTIPDVIYPITYLIPVRYFIEILRGLILRGAPFEAIWADTVALGVFAFVLMVLSTIRFRKRLD